MKKMMIAAWCLALGVAAGAARAADYTGGTVISVGKTVSGEHFSGTYENSVYIVECGAGDVTFENCTFDGVSAAANGSCVYINRGKGSGKVIFRNCRFINCGTEGKNDGGAIYIYDTHEGQSVEFENCVALGCKAKRGGFLYCDDDEAKIYGSNNTVISGCQAEYGGGAYFDDLTTFDGFILSDNSSACRCRGTAATGSRRNFRGRPAAGRRR